jgi:hypothetical protein
MSTADRYCTVEENNLNIEWQSQEYLKQPQLNQVASDEALLKKPELKSIFENH